MRRALVFVCLVACSACGDGYPAGHGSGGGEGGGSGTGGTGPDETAPIVIGAPVQLLAGGLTSHAAAGYGDRAIVAATRDALSPAGPTTSLGWTIVEPDGTVAGELPLELSPLFDDVGEGLTLGAAAVSGSLAFLALATDDAFYHHEFVLPGGAARGGGSMGGAGAPPRPFRPSTTPFALGFLTVFNGWGSIGLQLDAEGSSDTFGGFYTGFDPFVIGASGEAWLGWNRPAGARVARITNLEVPVPDDTFELGPADQGPVLAAGPETVVALTWGESLAAHLIAIDPPALERTVTVTAGPISGRPAALPWNGGFLVLWADVSGTELRGRLLAATGVALGAPEGFPVLALDEPVAFEPTHAIADDTGAWLTWETSTGLYGARLSRPVSP